MNNHNRNPHQSESRPDERPSGHIISRGLLHRENERSNAAQHRSASLEHRTIEHGSIRLGQGIGMEYEESGQEL